jgi:hydrogenase nickel incorporation protein HypA/HybF
MHEMGIANSILDAVRAETLRYPGGRVERVGIRLGEYSGVDTESLKFCFEALTRETDLEHLILEIEFRPGGEELDLSYLEIEEDHESSSSRKEGSE